MIPSYETILVEDSPEGGAGVRLIRLNRPQALNALNQQLLKDLGDALAEAEADDALGCTVITGSEKAFAAGADIKEMADKTYAEVFKEDLFASSAQAIEACRKPLIAAVSGYALGGGCELAMLCDFIIAADTAKFGQPEITLGVAPGLGGTQRLSRFVGKAKAMDLVLTGRMMDAAEAERCGLVSRIVSLDQLVPEALAAGAKIAGYSPLAVKMNKELVEAAFETTLAQGLQLERRLFHSLFAFDDQKEGMAAFVEKRKPKFSGH